MLQIYSICAGYIVNLDKEKGGLCKNRLATSFILSQLMKPSDG